MLHQVLSRADVGFSYVKPMLPALLFAVCMAFGLDAMAQDPGIEVTDFGVDYSSVKTSLIAQMKPVFVVAISIALGIFVVTFGWKVIRRFVK